MSKILRSVTFFALLPASIHAQAIQEHLDAAKKAAGTEWVAAADYFCSETAVPNRADDPEIAPTKLFDNVYAIGRSGTVVYAITTTSGIILIDSFYADQMDSVLLPGMKKLGLDPAQVKYIIVTHGHGDHFGGSSYLQERYSAKVVLSGADWDLVEKPPTGKGVPVTPPKRDVVAVEGQAITLGDVKVTPVFIPGHTPGAMGLIFPVKDGGRTHVAGLFGGTILTPRTISNEGLQTYSASIQHFAEMTKKMKVDVELQNHPIMDGMVDKLAKLKARKSGEANPFVVGEAGYGRFVNVMSECMKAQIARRAN